MTSLVHPKTQPLQSWQWRGDNLATAPLWVRMTCRRSEDALIHERQSGAQILNLDEWLVRDLDGEVNFYTAEEFAREFRT